jgi:hypothetical protein
VDIFSFSSALETALHVVESFAAARQPDPGSKSDRVRDDDPGEAPAPTTAGYPRFRAQIAPTASSGAHGAADENG